MHCVAVQLIKTGRFGLVRVEIVRIDLLTY